MPKLPWTFEANGDTPEVDGYNLYDAEGNNFGLVWNKEAAELICAWEESSE